jgi:O-antigen/teichoic acid export membrane protein
MAFAKMGVQNSIIRFYEEAKTGTARVSLQSFYSTLTFGPIVIVAAVCILYAVAVILLRGSFSEAGTQMYFLLSAAWTFFLCSNIVIKNFLRVEQNTELFNILNVVSKYSSLMLGVGLVYFFFKSLFGLYLAFIITEAVIFVYLMHRLAARQRIHVRHFDQGFFNQSLAYGFPLVGMEMTSVILNAGGRYVILYYMNTTAVGLYSAGYDLAMSAVESLIFPLSFAITPLYMKVHAQQGRPATAEFLSKCLRYFLMAAIPCLFGLNILGRDLTVLLASDKFEQAYKVIPYVSWGVLFYGLGNIFNAGILLEKKSYLLTVWTVIAGIINIGLNFLLIPLMGFVGSAVATLITYFVLFAVLARQSFVYLPFIIDYRRIGTYLAFAAIMAGVMYAVHLDHLLSSIMLKTAVGFSAYVLLILTFDADTRGYLFGWLRKRTGRPT